MKNVERIMDEIKGNAIQLEETVYGKMIEILYLDKPVVRIRLYDNNVFNFVRIQSCIYTDRFTVLPKPVQKAIREAIEQAKLDKYVNEVLKTNTTSDKTTAVLQRLFGQLSLLSIDYPTIRVICIGNIPEETEIGDSDFSKGEMYVDWVKSDIPNKGKEEVEQQRLINVRDNILTPSGDTIKIETKKQANLINDYMCECSKNKTKIDYDYVKELWNEGLYKKERLNILEKGMYVAIPGHENIDILTDKQAELIDIYLSDCDANKTKIDYDHVKKLWNEGLDKKEISEKNKRGDVLPLVPEVEFNARVLSFDTENKNKTIYNIDTENYKKALEKRMMNRCAMKEVEKLDTEIENLINNIADLIINFFI